MGPSPAAWEQSASHGKAQTCNPDVRVPCLMDGLWLPDTSLQLLSWLLRFHTSLLMVILRYIFWLGGRILLFLQCFFFFYFFLASDQSSYIFHRPNSKTYVWVSVRWSFYAFFFINHLTTAPGRYTKQSNYVPGAETSIFSVTKLVSDWHLACSSYFIFLLFFGPLR